MAKKLSAKEKRRREDLKTEARGLCYFVLGIYLLYCMAFSGSGAVGGFINQASTKLFGLSGRFAIAMACLAQGFFLLAKFEAFTNGNGSMYIAIMAVNALVLLGFGANGAYRSYSLASSHFYKALWNDPSAAGLIGQTASHALSAMLGTTGAALVVCLLSALSFIMVFRKSILEILRSAHAKPQKKKAQKAPAKASAPMADRLRLSSPKDLTGTAMQAKAESAPASHQQIIINEPLAGASAAASAPEPSLRGEYVLPPLSLLEQEPEAGSSPKRQHEVLVNATLLEKTLQDFGIEAGVSEVSVGPAVTRYELQLRPGIRVSKVINLADDIAMSLAAQRVRIEAPIPGKSAIGIEVPNKEISIVRLSQLISSEEFASHKSPLAVALGKDLTGGNMILDIASMPHLLIAGATGSGKSVCINTIIASILYHSPPEDVRMILIDPKMVELNVYNDIPHLLIPVVTDPKDAAGALSWAVREMGKRYEMFAAAKVRSIAAYNEKAAAEAEGEGKLAHILLVIDELNDLMLVSAQQVEASIIRLSQLARAAGIHLVLATQRPSVNVITGVIKANIPSRLSFAVMSQVDSRTILDMGGAEKLLGKGDMLYLPQDKNTPIRAQCAYIGDKEIENVVNFIKKKQTAEYDEDVMEGIKQPAMPPDASNSNSSSFSDELLPKAMAIAFEKNIISTSTIQRRLRLGYARAGRIIDEMEERGYISAADGSKPRKVLIAREEFGEGA
ncbi:MAG: DNA translocase FtsK [Eubacteriaceae bacterium]|nr:DNA translocase FtsK [Eubacteriaceae bacterium]